MCVSYYDREGETRVDRVKDAFRADDIAYVPPATAWIQTAASIGLLAAQTAILWNWGGNIDVPFVGPVAPHDFIVDDATVSLMSAMLGTAFGVMANGSLSDVRGNAPGIITGIGLIPAGANAILPAVGGYIFRKGVEGVSLGVASLLDRRDARRSPKN